MELTGTGSTVIGKKDLGMVIQHNLTAMNSNRQLGITTNLQAKSSEKLSSGYKINRAADDAAGLAISEKMRRQIRGLSQATENVQDGVSYVQVADGALAEIDEMLARMNQLCIQAATDTLTLEDRQAIDAEIQKIKEECNRTFKTTKFNEKLIWDENTTDARVVGHEDRYVFNTTISSGTNPGVTDVNRAAWPRNGQFSFNVSSDQTTMTVKWTGYDGVDYETNPITLPDEEHIHDPFTVDIAANMDYEKYPEAVGIAPKATYTLDPQGDRDLMIQNLSSNYISASNDLYFSATIYGSDTAGMYVNGGTIYNNDSFPYYAGINTRDIISGNDDGHILPIKDGEQDNNNVVRDAGNNMTLNFKVNVNSRAEAETEDATSITASAVSSTTVYTRAYDYRNPDPAAENVWWRYYNNKASKEEITSQFTGSNLDNAIKAALEGTNHHDSLISDKNTDGEIIIKFTLTGDEALHYTGKDKDGNDTTGNDSTDLGYFYLHVPVAMGEKQKDVEDKIKGITGIDLKTSGVSNMSLGTGRGWHSFDVMGGTMALDIQAGADNTQGDIIPLVYDVLNIHSLGMASLNTTTSETAKAGINIIKNAAKTVDYQRGQFGAYQNRMEHTIKNLGNVVENTTDAESQVRDTDMAAEMVRFSNNNILAQAGEAMMAQANQTNQGVMALLQ